MRKVWFIAALALPLGAATCNVNPDVATPNQVVIGINAYNSAVATGTAYLNLRLCSATVQPPCRTQAVSQQVYTALRSGRVARNILLQDLATNTTASITTIQTLETAYAVLNSIPK